jgi:hypothetical protein
MSNAVQSEINRIANLSTTHGAGVYIQKYVPVQLRLVWTASKTLLPDQGQSKSQHARIGQRKYWRFALIFAAWRAFLWTRKT